MSGTASLNMHRLNIGNRAAFPMACVFRTGDCGSAGTPRPTPSNASPQRRDRQAQREGGVPPEVRMPAPRRANDDQIFAKIETAAEARARGGQARAGAGGRARVGHGLGLGVRP
jgi:hypothetical protein